MKPGLDMIELDRRCRPADHRHHWPLKWIPETAMFDWTRVDSTVLSPSLPSIILRDTEMPQQYTNFSCKNHINCSRTIGSRDTRAAASGAAAAAAWRGRIPSRRGDEWWPRLTGWLSHFGIFICRSLAIIIIGSWRTPAEQSSNPVACQPEVAFGACPHRSVPARPRASIGDTFSFNRRFEYGWAGLRYSIVYKSCVTCRNDAERPGVVTSVHACHTLSNTPTFPTWYTTPSGRVAIL